MDAAVAALVGVAIGAVGSIGGQWLQQRSESRRDRLRLSVELGMSDHKGRLDTAMALGRGAKVPPVSAFVWYHARFLEAMKNGPVTPAEVETIGREMTELLRSFKGGQRDQEAQREGEGGQR